MELEGRYYILTADHVWNETDGWEEIGLMLAEEGTPLGIPRRYVVPKRHGGRPYTRLGPDLALLEIPPNLIGPIRARKSFLNLARRRSMLPLHPPRLEKTVWALIGMVGEASTVKLVPEQRMAIAVVRASGFFGWHCTTDTQGDYDYLTVSAKPALSGVPASFKGVSGGGLWEIVLKMKGDQIVSLGGHHFRGVAFFEEPAPEGSIAVRCHGPQSIFQTAWSAWGLPTGE